MEPPGGNWCILHPVEPFPFSCMFCYYDLQHGRTREPLNGEEPDAPEEGERAEEPLTEEPPLKFGETSTKEPTVKKPLAKKAKIAPFNAALTGKIREEDLLPPPKDFPAVKVAYISKEIGLGLVAARDFAAGEFIFHERPLMEASYNGHPDLARSRDLLESQYQAYKAVKSSDDLVKCIATAFPKFAARMGAEYQLPEVELLAILNGGIACNMIHGRLGKSSVTFQNFEEIWKKLKPYGPSDVEKRNSCHDFFKDYAFQTWNVNVGQRRGIEAAVTVPAYIYLLASLINHRCPPKDSMVAKLFTRLTKKTSDQNTGGTATAAATGGAAPPAASAASDSGPNCTWQISSGGLARFIDEKAIAARAKRDIREGEELTWDYGRKVGFKCLCRTCKK